MRHADRASRITWAAAIASGEVCRANHLVITPTEASTVKRHFLLIGKHHRLRAPALYDGLQCVVEGAANEPASVVDEAAPDELTTPREMKHRVTAVLFGDSDQFRSKHRFPRHNVGSRIIDVPKGHRPDIWGGSAQDNSTKLGQHRMGRML